MPYTREAKRVMLDVLRLAASHVGLHSGEPASANEVSGGQYARLLIRLPDPVNGVIELNTAGLVFALPVGAEVTHAGLWTDRRGGVLLAWEAIEPASFERQGIYVLDAVKLDLNL